MTTRISIPKQIETKAGTVSAGIIGCTNLWSFAMDGGPKSGMEVVCVRGKKRAARVVSALTASDAVDYMGLRIAAFAAKKAA